MGQKYFMGVDISKQKIDLKLITASHESLDEAIVKNDDAAIHKYLLQVIKNRRSSLMIF